MVKKEREKEEGEETNGSRRKMRKKKKTVRKKRRNTMEKRVGREVKERRACEKCGLMREVRRRGGPSWVR